jgi:putative endonuclease
MMSEMKPNELVSLSGRLPSHLVSGREAELRAARFLESQGVRIIEKNYRVKSGEIDIVAQDATMLIFVEVRWRRNHSYGGAIESLSTRKLKRMHRAASTYLQHHRCTLPCRLDVLCQVGEITSDWVWVRGLL